MAKANRRSRPWTLMARARMKLPRKRKMVGSAKGARTVLASATPARMHRTAPSRALTGMGTGSPIHQTTIQAMMAARACARARGPGMGMNHKTSASSGPRKRLTLCRQDSNFPSTPDISVAGAAGRSSFNGSAIFSPVHGSSAGKAIGGLFSLEIRAWGWQTTMALTLNSGSNGHFRSS